MDTEVGQFESCLGEYGLGKLYTPPDSKEEVDACSASVELDSKDDAPIGKEQSDSAIIDVTEEPQHPLGVPSNG